MSLHITYKLIMSKLSVLKALISNSISRHLASDCNGLQCLYDSGRAGQGSADSIGSEADLPGRRGLN